MASVHIATTLLKLDVQNNTENTERETRSNPHFWKLLAEEESVDRIARQGFKPRFFVCHIASLTDWPIRAISGFLFPDSRIRKERSLSSHRDFALKYLAIQQTILFDAYFPRKFRNTCFGARIKRNYSVSTAIRTVRQNLFHADSLEFGDSTGVPAYTC